MTPERLAHVTFVAARVLAEVAANPPTLPLLGTPEDTGRCRYGHPLSRRKNGHRECRTCQSDRQRKRRARR